MIFYTDDNFQVKRLINSFAASSLIVLDTPADADNFYQNKPFANYQPDYALLFADCARAQRENSCDTLLSAIRDMLVYLSSTTVAKVLLCILLPDSGTPCNFGIAEREYTPLMKAAGSSGDSPENPVLALEDIVRPLVRDGLSLDILRIANLVADDIPSMVIPPLPEEAEDWDETRSLRKEAYAIGPDPSVRKKTRCVISQMRQMCSFTTVSALLTAISRLMNRPAGGGIFHSSQFVAEYKAVKRYVPDAVPLCLAANKLTAINGQDEPVYPELDPEYYYEKNYDGKLPRIKEIELEIAEEIKRICEKHQIRYFLVGGSLLGAIRHNGFIPWDDDFDIGMLRSDYETFRRVAPKELEGSRYEYQSYLTDPDCHYVFDKIRLKDTYFSTEFSAHFPIANGLFVDILVYDYTSVNPAAQKRQIERVNALKGAINVKWLDEPSKINHRLLTAVALPAMKLVSFRRFHKIIEKNLTRYDKEIGKKLASGELTSGDAFLIDGVGMNLQKGAFPAKWFDELIPHEFDGHSFPIPAGYDAYLTHWFTDRYMEPLPPEKRSSGHILPRIDLGAYITGAAEQYSDSYSINTHGELFED